MKLLKDTLNILNDNIGLNNINQPSMFPGLNNLGLYNDNRRKFVTKQIEDNNPQILEKGDKMKIPGVLDYTEAKYPFKKKKKKRLIKKHQSGGDTYYEFNSPEDNQTYYMKSNEPFDENGQRLSYTDTSGSNPAPTSIQLPEVTVIGNKETYKAKQKLTRLHLPTDVLKFNRSVELINNLPDENVKAAFKRREMIEDPKIGEELEPEILDLVDLFYKTDISNRIKKAHPELSESDLNTISNIIDKIPIRYGNYMDKQFVLGNWNGFHQKTPGGSGDYISINPFYVYDLTELQSTIAHELTHGYRQGKGNYMFDNSTGYNNDELSTLNNAYTGMKGFEYGRDKSSIQDESEFNSVIEKGTTNAELRYRLFKDFYVKYKKEPSVEELDRYIDSLDSQELIDLFRHINGYSSYMYRTNLRYKDEKSVADKIKQALKLVAFNDSKKDNMLLAKSGSKINKNKKAQSKIMYTPGYMKKGGSLIRKMQTASGGSIGKKQRIYVQSNKVPSFDQKVPVESTRVHKNPSNVEKYVLPMVDGYYFEIDNNRKYNLHDPYVQEFFQYDYAPRFQNENKLIAKSEYVDTAKNISKNTKITRNNLKSGISGETEYYTKVHSPNVLGKIMTHLFYNKKDPQITLNQRLMPQRSTLVHELSHAFRQGYLGGQSDDNFSENSSITYNPYNSSSVFYDYRYGSGYSKNERNKLQSTYKIPDFNNNLNEIGATNTTIRFTLWKELYDKLGRRPTIYETDNYIKNYDESKLQEMIKNDSDYGESMYKNGLNVNKVKDTLIHVAKNDNTVENNENLLYGKKGSKINIKKKNRGKFTDYCGGNVTQSCINRAKRSGNKTLVKRAVFAENARKWKH